MRGKFSKFTLLLMILDVAIYTMLLIKLSKIIIIAADQLKQ